MPKGQSKKQSRETGNIGYIRRRKTKQKQRAPYKQLDAKTHNRTTQKIEKDEQHGPTNKNGDECRCLRRISSTCFL